MRNVLQKILMLAGAAGPVVIRVLPGALGTALGSILVGLGLLGGLTHPTPAAVAAFGTSAK